MSQKSPSHFVLRSFIRDQRLIFISQTAMTSQGMRCLPTQIYMVVYHTNY